MFSTVRSGFATSLYVIMVDNGYHWPSCRLICIKNVQSHFHCRNILYIQGYISFWPISPTWSGWLPPGQRMLGAFGSWPHGIGPDLWEEWHLYKAVFSWEETHWQGTQVWLLLATWKWKHRLHLPLIPKGLVSVNSKEHCYTTTACLVVCQLLHSVCVLYQAVSQISSLLKAHAFLCPSPRPNPLWKPVF